jgi:hypothetical protein
MILTVSLNSNEFRFYSLPKLKLLKFTRPKAQLKNYKFHEHFPILLDLFENQRRKELRIYDPFLNQFYLFAEIPKPFQGLKPYYNVNPLFKEF